MRFASLGSGSRGNATLVGSGSTLVMVDCGFTCRETERRMQRLGCSPDDLDAVFVTHEHGDHVRGVAVLARKYGMPVWMTRGTRSMLRDGDIPGVCYLEGESSVTVNDLRVSPFTVPHDAREPCQFTFEASRGRFGMLTDVGRSTPHIVDSLGGCDALLLECNHDSDMLAGGPYPESLKRRVGGALGHLSNAQAGELLASLDTGRLQHLVAAHLSDKNNQPGLARQALAAALGCEPDWVGVACQEQGFDWRVIG